MYSGNWTFDPPNSEARADDEASFTISFYGTGLYLQGSTLTVSALFERE
jgi:hypothetical protein